MIFLKIITLIAEYQNIGNCLILHFTLSVIQFAYKPLDSYIVTSTRY
jgi:hypothetical protein